MAIFIPFKAPPNEHGSHKKIRQRERYCRICGKPITAGTYCPSCHHFIMQQKERNKTE